MDSDWGKISRISSRRISYWFVLWKISIKEPSSLGQISSVVGKDENLGRHKS